MAEDVGKLVRKSRAKAATVEHRKTADRMFDRKLGSAAREAFDKHVAKIERALARQISDTPARATRAHVRAAEQILRASSAALGKQLSATLAASTRETRVEAVRSLATFMGTFKPNGTALDDDAIREKLVRAGLKDAQERRREQALSTAKGMYKAAKGQLADLGPLPQAELLAKAKEIAKSQWWHVDRTLRTETSAVFNEVQGRAFIELKEEFPNLLVRWTELVSDITGAPLDSRVGVDSILMHGQVCRPGESFKMPSTARTPGYLVGGAWLHPPNRPNDRAVLTPWEPGWGVPAYRLRGGRRVSLK